MLLKGCIILEQNIFHRFYLHKKNTPHTKRTHIHTDVNLKNVFLGITPPGACCPLCGGALRMLYSRKQIDRALYALPTPNTGPLYLRSTLLALERQIQLAQCRLRGYITIELDIFVLVQTTER